MNSDLARTTPLERATPLVRALVATGGLALLLGILLGRPEFFALALPLLIALLLGAVPEKIEPGSIRLRSDKETLSEGEEVTIDIEAGLAGAHGCVQIIPVLPPLFHPLDAPRSPMLVPAREQLLAWRCRGRPDAATVLHFDAVFLRAFDPSGLWLSEWGENGRLTLTVLPRALAVGRLPRPRMTRALFGMHASTAAGEGVAFADLRPFAAGDRLRQINWPVSLRRQSLHANRYHAERQAEIVLLIDTFMTIGQRPDASLDHILRAAAGFAATALRCGDRVGLLEFGGIARSLAGGTGQGHYVRILHALARAAPVYTEFAQDLAALPEHVLSRRALVLALTPLADERFDRAVIRLAERGQDIALFALATAGLSPGLVRRRDQAPLVLRLWHLEREERLRALRRAGVRAVNWSPGSPLDAAIGLLQATDAKRRAA